MNSHVPVRGLLCAAFAAVVATSVGPPSAAVADGVAAAAPAARVTLDGSGESTRVRNGRRVVVAGYVEPRDAGRSVVLERAFLGRAYRPVGRTLTRAGGSYRFVTVARRSAVYRAVVQPPVAASATGPAVSSSSRRVVVVARIAASATRHAAAGERVKVRGRMRPALRGRLIRVQLRTGSRWRTVARARTGRGGRFAAAWRPSGIGLHRLRVRFAGDAAAAGARDRLAVVRVYRATQASWYGPGLYGNPTACGGVLTPWRLGVAHRSLPCGTKVTLRYRGRSVTVPVIDRGPFAAGREWDLTAATKSKLGFGDVGVVWATR